jgi:hypothetical protein
MSSRLSPPRPADLTSIIQRIEDRRSSAAAAAAAAVSSAHHGFLGPSVSFASPSPSYAPASSEALHHSAARRGTTSPQRRSPSLIAGLVTSHTTDVSTSSAFVGASASTEVSLLRLDLQQRLAELDLKKKTILKLEGDNLRLLHELDSSRISDAERRDVLAKAHREELHRERQLNEELQNKLLAEVATRGQAERAASTAKDLRVRVDSLEDQLRQKEAVLADRERALDDAVEQRRRAEVQLREHEAADVSNILKGRLSLVEERLEASQEQLHQMQNALASEERRRKDVELGLAEALRAVEEKSSQLSQVSTQSFELESTIVRLRADADRQHQKLEKVQAQQLQREEEHTRDLLALQHQLDESHSESRKRMQQIFQLETHIAELQEQRRSGADANEAVAENNRALQAELSAVRERLKQAHTSVEERESELSKMHVISVEHRNQIAALRAQTATLQRELDITSTSAREAREEVGEMSMLLAQKATAEERLTIARKAHAALEREIIEEQQSSSQLRDRAAVLEQQLEVARQSSTKYLELQRVVAARDEDVSALQADIHVWRLKEASLKDDLAASKEKCHVAETKFLVEVERRDEVERKLRLLEEAHSTNLGIYGKYAALQQYLSTASSEASKALELNNALLEEVKALEVSNRDLQRRLDLVTEERSVLGAQAAEAQVYKTDMERALARAREAEGREHEMLVTRRNDPLQRRVQELEAMMVDAVRRATAAEVHLSALQQLQHHANPQPSIAGASSRDVSPSSARMSPARPPLNIDAPAPQPTSSSPSPTRHHNAHHDEVSSVSSNDSPQRHHEPTAQERTTIALGMESQATSSREALVDRIELQQSQLLSQDRRLELLSLQFADALSELKQLKEDDATQKAARSQSLASQRSTELSPASTTTSSAWGSGAAVDLRRALLSAHEDINRAHARVPSTLTSMSPLVLAQRQQRSRIEEIRPVTDARTPTPPRTAMTGRFGVGRSSPDGSSRGSNLRGGMSSPPRRDGGLLFPLGTPPRVPSPKTARIHEQRAALTDTVREKMSRLFQNAREVSLASPSPQERAPRAVVASPTRGESPATPRSASMDAYRRLTGVMSPVR